MVAYNREIVFDGVRKYTGKLNEQQVLSINSIIDAAEKYSIGSKHLAYILSTAYYESTFKPVRETFASSSSQAVARLEKAYGRKKRNKYWRVDKSTGQAYFGRGFVQLTHKYNYEKMGTFLGIDLVNNPSMALVPSYAAEILVYGMKNGSFTGKKLSSYKTYYSMRKIVNGLDKAKKFASLAEKLDNFTAVAEKTAPKPITRPTPKPIDDPTPINTELDVIVQHQDGRVFIEVGNKRGAYESVVHDREVEKIGLIEGDSTMETKHALASTTVRGVLMGAFTVGLPPLLKLFGYDIDQMTASDLGNHGAALVQLLVGIYASGLALHGRQEAKSRIWWFTK